LIYKLAFKFFMIFACVTALVSLPMGQGAAPEMWHLGMDEEQTAQMF
jgi:hypothetical protein